MSIRTHDAEPIAMMVQASQRALAETVLILPIQSVRVVKGIWPYKDPGRLVAKGLELGDGVTTALTGIGGNATYDVLNQTATDIANGTIETALLCGAESMRTRRRDRSEGRLSPYVDEVDGATPDLLVAPNIEMVDDLDVAAKIDHPVNFYAMAETAIRHRRGETPAAHLDRISSMWERGNIVASQNPDAWLQKRTTASQIASVDAANRMVATPYTKLLTSNINVDQATAVVMCSYETALKSGVPPDAMVFLVSGSGAADHLPVRARMELDRSPAFRLSSERALALAGQTIHDIEQLDLYSCFPSSVQVAQAELQIDPARPFTMTGGLTFAGGPFNGYCTQALAHAARALRGTNESAFLHGNGGYFSKHSVVLISGSPPTQPFSYERVQEQVDALPRRGTVVVDGNGTIEAYTVPFGRDGEPSGSIISVLDDDGNRSWAEMTDRNNIEVLLSTDQVGRMVQLTSTEHDSVPVATFV